MGVPEGQESMEVICRDTWDTVDGRNPGPYQPTTGERRISSINSMRLEIEVRRQRKWANVSWYHASTCHSFFWESPRIITFLVGNFRKKLKKKNSFSTGILGGGVDPIYKTVISDKCLSSRRRGAPFQTWRFFNPSAPNPVTAVHATTGFGLGAPGHHRNAHHNRSNHAIHPNGKDHIRHNVPSSKAPPEQRSTKAHSVTYPQTQERKASEKLNQGKCWFIAHGELQW